MAFSHQPLPDDGTFDLNIHGHEHDKPQDNGEKCKLISLELMGYQPVLLETFINKL
jgi:calcineurin-like phosphoesterase family protein